MASRVAGKVVAIDPNGDLISDLTSTQLAAARPLGAQVHIRCDEHETFGLFDTVADMPAMTFAAFFDVEGQLRLTITADRAAEMLGIEVGTPVTVSW